MVGALVQGMEGAMKLHKVGDREIERDAKDKALGGGPMGMDMRLEHEHIKALRLDGALPHGTGVHLEGHGHVVDSGSHEGPDGEAMHHMTIRFHRAGVEHDGDDAEDSDVGARGQLRGELKRNTDAAESQAAEREVKRGEARSRTGEKVQEKA